MSSEDLLHSISVALGDVADDYDIEGIAAAVREAGGQTVDDLDGPQFWGIVEANALPDQEPQPDPSVAFRQEMTTALTQKRPTGFPAVWRRGGVTVTVTGASRVRHTWPQPTATINITSTTGHEATLHGATVENWDALWQAVEPLLTEWQAAVTEARETAAQAEHKAASARQKASRAARDAKNAQTALQTLLADSSSTESKAAMTGQEVADYLGIAKSSVRRQMSRWEIEAVYERGPSGRPEARYPIEDVQSAAARRPGRGARTDLPDRQLDTA